MEGLILTRPSGVRLFIARDSIVRISEAREGFSVIYGLGSYMCKEEYLEAGELVMRDYSEYLRLVGASK